MQEKEAKVENEKYDDEWLNGKNDREHLELILSLERQ